MKTFVGWLCCFLCGFQTALGFVSDVNGTGQVRRWQLTEPNPLVHTNVVNTNSHAIRYYIAADAFSSTNKTAEQNAVRACFARWEVPGSSLRFEDAGLAEARADVNLYDGTNLVVWAKGSTIVNGGFDDLTGRLAASYPSWLGDETLLEADIVLNGVEYAWTTGTQTPASP
jgi:hypothetical protein